MDVSSKEIGRDHVAIKFFSWKGEMNGAGRYHRKHIAPGPQEWSYLCF